MALLMYIDGVLRTKKKVPIRESVALYRTLKTTQKIFIICTDKTEAERWLKENNLGKFDDLIGTDVPDFHNNPLVSQAEYVRSQGPVDLVIVADTETAKELLERGFRTLLLLDPYYLDPASRPDSKDGRKSWIDIQAELDKQQELYLEDPRV